MSFPKPAPKSAIKAIYIRLDDNLAEYVEAEQRRFGLSATDVARIALAERRERALA